MPETEELIITVDPGGTTGYAYTTLDEMSRGIAPHYGQLPPQEFCEWLESVLGSWGERAVVVVEKFTISARTLKVSRGGSYDAIEVMGVCRYLSLRDYGKDIVVQQPSEVMALFPDAWLRERGWYAKGQGHANDALRHMARHLAGRGLIHVRSM